MRSEDVTPGAPYSSPIFRANYFTFVLIRTGQSSYTLDGTEYLVNPRTLYFTNPGHLKGFGVKRDVTGFLISFSDSFLQQFINNEPFQQYPFLLSEIVPPQSLTDSFFEQLWQLGELILVEQKNPQSTTKEVIASYFNIFLLKVKAKLYETYDPIAEGDRSSALIRTFKQLIEEHFRALLRGQATQVPSVQTLADDMRLHPNYLSTIIKSKTGKTVHDWISQRVLLEAQGLLRSTNLSIKEVAYQLGFNEANYFGKFFKKATGLTPGTYRKQA